MLTRESCTNYTLTKLVLMDFDDGKLQEIDPSSRINPIAVLKGVHPDLGAYNSNKNKFLNNPSVGIHKVCFSHVSGNPDYQFDSDAKQELSFSYEEFRNDLKEATFFTRHRTDSYIPVSK